MKKEPVDEYADEDVDMVECESCGRKFVESAFDKHINICDKVFNSKRKAFDSKKYRVIDSEHATILKRKEYEEKKATKNVKNNNNNNLNKKPKWKRQSEELRAIMSCNKTTTSGFGSKF